MAYRREALLTTGGFDERFPRAFREDSDLALRTTWPGTRSSGRRGRPHPSGPAAVGEQHPAQAGNADNALLREVRAALAPARSVRAGEAAGRTCSPWRGATGADRARRPVAGRRVGRAAVGRGDRGVRRPADRPGTADAGEIATMIVTSAADPAGGAGRTAPRRVAVPSGPPDPAAAVLFDRDGTLIHDVPYLADPGGVRPVPGRWTRWPAAAARVCRSAWSATSPAWPAG